MPLIYPYDTQLRLLNILYGNSPFTVALIDGTVTAVSLTAANVGLTLHVFNVANEFVANTRVQLSVSAGGTLPTSVAPNVINSTDTYYISAPTASRFALSQTKNGAAIRLATQGSGTITVRELPLGILDADASAPGDVANWIRHEVPSYNGSGRQTYTPGLGTIDNATGIAATPPRSVTFTPTTGDIIGVRYALIIRGGNTTRGDTTGTIEQFEDFVTPFNFVNNQPRLYNIQHTSLAS